MLNIDDKINMIVESDKLRKNIEYDKKRVLNKIILNKIRSSMLDIHVYHK